MPVTGKEIADTIDGSTFGVTKGRRAFLEPSLAGLILPPRLLRAAAPAPADAVLKKIFQQGLPKINLDDWDFVAGNPEPSAAAQLSRIWYHERRKTAGQNEWSSP